MVSYWHTSSSYQMAERYLSVCVETAINELTIHTHTDKKEHIAVRPTLRLIGIVCIGRDVTECPKCN